MWQSTQPRTRLGQVEDSTPPSAVSLGLQVQAAPPASDSSATPARSHGNGRACPLIVMSWVRFSRSRTPGLPVSRRRPAPHRGEAVRLRLLAAGDPPAHAQVLHRRRVAADAEHVGDDRPRSPRGARCCTCAEAWPSSSMGQPAPPGSRDTKCSCAPVSEHALEHPRRGRPAPRPAFPAARTVPERPCRITGGERIRHRHQRGQAVGTQTLTAAAPGPGPPRALSPSTQHSAWPSNMTSSSGAAARRA